MILNADAKKPIIEYPCKWSYKLIGRIEKLIKEEVENIIIDKEFSLTVANRSKTGKFVSLELTVEVIHEEERLKYFEHFSQSQVIMQVL